MEYVHSGDGYFTIDDYRKADQAEHIRSVSDYDDFYIASKEETVEQVEFAYSFYVKVKQYISDIDENN